MADAIIVHPVDPSVRILPVPGFPVWDLAGLLGSTGWGLWVAALGFVLLLPVRPARAALQSSADAASTTAPTPRSAPAGQRS